MTKQTEAAENAETVLQVKETGARVVVKDGRFKCEGCGGGYSSDVALKMAQNHAEYCAVLPLD
jgi:hypothetical protein